jgi:hypothetical protein
VLTTTGEEIERRYRLRAQGYGLKKMANRGAELFGLKKEKWLRPGKYDRVVAGSRLLRCLAVRELEAKSTDLEKKVRITHRR